MLFQCLNTVYRTGRIVPAGGGQQGRYKILVKFNQADKYCCQSLSEEIVQAGEEP